MRISYNTSLLNPTKKQIKQIEAVTYQIRSKIHTVQEKQKSIKTTQESTPNKYPKIS